MAKSQHAQLRLWTGMGTLLTIADITITTLIFYMRSAQTIHFLFDWTCTVWTKALAHCLYKSCSAMETHAMKLPANRYCADINVRGGLSLCRGLATFTDYAPQRSTTPLCNFMCQSCCVSFHFYTTIIQITSGRASVWCLWGFTCTPTKIKKTTHQQIGKSTRNPTEVWWNSCRCDRNQNMQTVLRHA